VLRVDASRVRQRLAARTLFGFKVGRQWRIPAWQFAGHRELPGLAEILPELRIEDPVAVGEFFASPNEDLTSDGQALAPIEWLSAGRAPRRVTELLGSVAIA
jgi:hypothetical protein